MRVVHYTSGQPGRTLNVDATLKLLQIRLKTFADGEVPLVIMEVKPDVLEASVEADALRRVLDGPMTLEIPDTQAGDPGPWTLESWQVAEMISIGRASSGIAFMSAAM